MPIPTPSQVPSPPPPPAFQIGQNAVVENAANLQGLIRELAQNLRQTTVQREVMRRQLANASGQEAVALRSQLAAVNGEIGELSARIGDASSRLAQIKVDQAMPHIGVPTFPPPMRPMIDPDAVTAVFVMFSIGIIVPLSVGLTRRLWRRPAPRPQPRDGDGIDSPRLERLEQAVDAIAIEIERISEGQRFVTKVLTERMAPPRSSAGGDARDVAGIDDAKPFLALGAGPIEAIRVAERQPVKQSVTPH